MKLFKVLLCIFLLNITVKAYAEDLPPILPVQEPVIQANNPNDIKNANIIDESIESEINKSENGILTNTSQNDVMFLTFTQDFDVNKSEKGKEIVLKSDSEFQDMDGDFIPKNTMFYGKVNSVTKSKSGFRKARAKISIHKMVFPDGRTYRIKGVAKDGSLSSSKGANIVKGVASTIVSVGVCVTGVVLITFECLSIGGAVFAPYTGVAAGLAVAATSRGLNYKVKAGTKIPVRFIKIAEQ